MRYHITREWSENNCHGGIPCGRSGSRHLHGGGGRGCNLILGGVVLVAVLLLVGAALAGRVRGLRREAQDTADPQGLHRATVRLETAEPGGLPPRILPEAREGELRSEPFELRVLATSSPFPLVLPNHCIS